MWCYNSPAEFTKHVSILQLNSSRKMLNLKISLVWFYNSIVIKPVMDSVSSTEISLHYLTHVSLYRQVQLVNSGDIRFKHYSAESLFFVLSPCLGENQHLVKTNQF
jgi:hypothetical protein